MDKPHSIEEFSRFFRADFKYTSEKLLHWKNAFEYTVKDIENEGLKCRWRIASETFSKDEL